MVAGLPSGVNNQCQALFFLLLFFGESMLVLFWQTAEDGTIGVAEDETVSGTIGAASSRVAVGPVVAEVLAVLWWW